MPHVSFPWLAIFLILVISGALGGFARHVMDFVQKIPKNASCKDDTSRNGKGSHGKNGIPQDTENASSGPEQFKSRVLDGAFPSIITGAIAGLVVPLFLNASASELIEGILEGLPDGKTEANQNIFFLIGYCLLAGLVGNHFLTSMAAQAFRASKEAEQRSKKAEKRSEKAITLATKASEVATHTANLESKMENFQKGRMSIELEDFAEAEKCFLLHTQKWPDDPIGYAWLAYTYKRTKSVPAKRMIDLIEQAISLKKQKPHKGHIGEYEGPYKWLMNLACYYALDNRNSAEVTAILRKAFESAKANNKLEIIKSLRNTLTRDPDLDSVKGGSEYNKLLTEVSEFLNSNQES